MASEQCICRCGYRCGGPGRCKEYLSDRCLSEHFAVECGHVWDGEPWESADGAAWSVTCSRCGTTRMHHDMRVGP